ncbi:DNA adenine methylase [Roseovarius azorensis]|uniref:DNA adenine methylase n=1 Tax=Roseovarius azorensis TaxID=1287727 RepID=A0A1H7G212_9RHOB|nr:DNA adenine methylase [Roseovarius azorensis]
MFARADFERLATLMARIRGKAILSINDVPQIRQVFSGFHMEEVSTTYTIGTKNDSRGQRGELLISSFGGS